MLKLKVENFGPIKEGYTDNDGYLIIPDVTLFIGDQGSGKSSVAKILSTCCWIEKALLKDSDIYKLESEKRYIFKNSELPDEDYDLKYRLEYQNVHQYFSDDSFIEYIGDYYRITYAAGETSFESLHAGKEGQAYKLPQIMYVPAERNFISVVEGAKSVKNLPSPLYTFLDEYEAAILALDGGKQKLPLGDFEYQYDNAIKQGVILDPGGNYRIKLSVASSGLQSATPLFLVSDYLSKLINGEYETLRTKRLSLADDKSKQAMIYSVLDSEMDDQQKANELQNVEDRFANERFLNIVEEMEQNLYPKSQQSMLHDLIRCVNNTQGNSLVLTTHSPYVINYLSLAIKAYSVYKKADKQNSKLIARLEKIVPTESIISGESVAIYELDQNGRIHKLSTFGDGVPSDNNYLNESLRITNDLYNDLLELEDEA